ncbi:MAG: NIPSNAP family protein [Isosphaeraceae bacterium]
MRTTIATVAFLSLAGLALAADKDQGEKPCRVFELRTYYTNDGKLVDLHKRFREHTCALLKKHGAELIGFWTPRDEKDGKGSKLIYLVAFPSREAAAETWKAFSDDPEWKRAYAESHKNGVLVKKVESVYMDPTDYSEMK